MTEQNYHKNSSIDFTTYSMFIFGGILLGLSFSISYNTNEINIHLSNIEKSINRIESSADGIETRVRDIEYATPQELPSKKDIKDLEKKIQ
jgi:hypothetical protein